MTRSRPQSYSRNSSLGDPWRHCYAASAGEVVATIHYGVREPALVLERDGQRSRVLIQTLTERLWTYDSMIRRIGARAK